MGLKLKPKKCFQFQKWVSYLGHVVTEEGISTDPEDVGCGMSDFRSRMSDVGCQMFYLGCLMSQVEYQIFCHMSDSTYKLPYKTELYANKSKFGTAAQVEFSL